MNTVIAVFIANMSAIDFVRKKYPPWKAPSTALEYLPELSPAYKSEDVWSLAPSWVTPQFLKPENGVLHILTFHRSNRSHSKTLQSHVWSAPIPAHSFYQLSPDAYIASPAFALLEMANSLSFAQTLALICELCGLYSFDESQERGFLQRTVPLTTKAQIDRYLDGAKGVSGQSKIAHALQFAAERSASPMETVCFLLLCLPYRYGGYGLPFPTMNLEVPLNPQEKRLLRKDHCTIDLAWCNQHLAVEYLGLYDHSSKEAIGPDRARTGVLESKGYTVIELTGDQVWNLDSFEQIALRIARKLGKRIEREYLGVQPARLELRRQLKSWNEAFGRPSLS